MDKKNIFITVGITFALFTFIMLLLYIIYCFAYFDKYQEETFINNVNDNYFDFVYKNIRDNKGLTLSEFNIPIKLMYDKNNLKDLYYKYYANSEFETLDEFINTYYYKGSKVVKDNILFESKGKTGFFHRKKLFYSSINVKSPYGNKSSLGLKSNIIFNIDGVDDVYLDDNALSCTNNKCIIEYLFGGLHTIKFNSNGFDFFAILNISKNNQIIDVSSLENVVKINSYTYSSSDDIVVDANVKFGIYKLSYCNLDSGCPVKSKSYIKLNNDGSCILYTYISLSKAGDRYVGSYDIEGNFLVMKFKEHTYTMFDYDTQQASDIVGTVDMELRYKIENNSTLSNDDYMFKFSE